MEAPSTSDRTSNEISGGSQVGGNAYQAKHMHFGGRSIGLTVVGLAAVGALAYVAVNAGAGTGQAAAPASQSPTAASTAPSPSPSKSATATTTPPADGKAKAAEPAPSPERAKAIVKAATGSTPYSGKNLYCGGWRGSPSGSNLMASACTQVTGSDVAFGVMLRNVGKSQITVGMTLKYVHGQTLDCPGGGYPAHDIRIDPGTTWYSNLGLCSVGSLKDQINFQALGEALETSDEHASLSLGGAQHSPTATFTTAGVLKCREKDSSVWGSCDTLWPYPPVS
ncbi:hypothetical protein OIB37_21115 [Streptomyces sp. NBC_00820]|uniref:hypothetical protein n=1 Tax=Streptomyces sp. NBC_00820 TaxID=2975842 RepID=UPI002ECFE040|nr:hypothetical protein OIB37_21115 [Streptomyces sp. NBC_00820]